MQSKLYGLRLSRYGAARTGTCCLSTIALLLAGCGGADNDSQGTAVSATTATGLTATIAQNRSQVSGLRDVTYTLSLRNDTTETVTFQGNTGLSSDKPAPTAKLEVMDEAGVLVYPSATLPERPARASTSVTLAPGRSISDSYPFSSIETIRNPLFPRAGNYRATATFTVSGTQTVAGPLVISVR